MIAITFPDGAQRSFEPGVSGVDIAKSISPSLAKRTVAMVLDGQLARLRRPHQRRRAARIHRPRRSPRAGADPPRRRPCAGRCGAGGFSGHAGHHRPGDRKRLLLRFFPRRAVHAGRFRRHREEDARDHRRRQTDRARGMDARRGQGLVRDPWRGVQGRTDRRHFRRPENLGLQAGRLARPLPRPAYALDRQDRHRRSS